MVMIDWSAPSDLGGLSISGYIVEIKGASGAFSKDLTNCDAETNTSIIQATSCSIPVGILQALPFNLLEQDSVFARITAFNDIGSSTASSEGNGGAVPIDADPPEAPSSFSRNDAQTTKTQVAFSWSPPASDGGSEILDYSIEMDDDNDDVYVEVATGVTLTSYIKTGLSSGVSYRFRVRARNLKDLGTYSAPFTIVAATVPSQPSPPVTTNDGETGIIITWSAPTDSGGITLDGYKVEIKTSTSSFELDSTNCDAENNSSIRDARTCTIPVDVLRDLPFNWGNSDSIFVRITAVNDVGDSTPSAEGNGASLPIAPVEPDQPTLLVRNDAQTSKT